MTKPAGWDAVNNYKHPTKVTVRLTLFWTASVTADPAERLVRVATKMLQEHNLDLSVYKTSLKTADMTLSSNKPMPAMSDEFDAHAKVLRNLCHQVYRDDRPRLPVIFVPFSGPKSSEPCDVNGVAVKNTDWLPFVLINSNLKSEDGVTLLHEIGHAAGLGHFGKGPNDVAENFMGNGTNRTNMIASQVKAIAGAYFCR
jgi:hypothetical protein